MTEQEKQAIRDNLGGYFGMWRHDIERLLDTLDERDLEVEELKQAHKVAVNFGSEQFQENQRLRKALEWIADTTGNEQMRLIGCPSIARKALEGEEKE